MNNLNGNLCEWRLTLPTGEQRIYLGREAVAAELLVSQWSIKHGRSIDGILIERVSKVVLKEKVCTQCGVLLPISSYTRKRGGSLYAIQCKSCHAQRNLRRYRAKKRGCTDKRRVPIEIKRGDEVHRFASIGAAAKFIDCHYPALSYAIKRDGRFKGWEVYRA